uniref:Uncharacterized protein n=1 Tax=Arundo donax TaxID=35708 RepID=A0A0A9HGB7_ARUDO
MGKYFSRFFSLSFSSAFPISYSRPTPPPAAPAITHTDRSPKPTNSQWRTAMKPSLPPPPPPRTPCPTAASRRRSRSP